MVMQDEYMSKDAAITVRISIGLKRRLEALARQERRSLSAQVATCLEENMDARPDGATEQPARLLGLFEGGRVPAEKDFAEVRRLLWGSLGKRVRRGRA